LEGNKVSVSKEMVDMFRNYMKDKGLEEIPAPKRLTKKLPGSRM
jgi:hypothetical protein